MAALTLIFPDGSMVSGADWEDLEAALRASQWRTYKTRRAFRRDMRRRAATWSGRSVKPVGYQGPRGFIMSLVHAEMCTLVTDTTTEEKP